MTTTVESPQPPVADTPASARLWTGEPRPLGQRIGRTYAAVAAGLVVALGLGLPLAFVAATLGEGWDGLGYAVMVLLATSLIGAVLTALLCIRMRLGWATVALLPVVLAPVVVSAWADAGVVGLLVAAAWPAVVGALVGARGGATTRIAVVAAVLVVTVAGSLVLAWTGEARRVDSRAQTLARTGLPLLAPAEVAGTDWGYVMATRSTVIYTFEGADGYDHRVEIGPRVEAPEETVGAPDGTVVRVRGDRATARVHGEAVVVVTSSRAGTGTDPEFSQDRSEAVARALVERSPAWLAARPERLRGLVDR